jgi:hypothetical protein
VATRIWGDYRFSPTQYVSWLHTFRPAWAAMMDYCCEDELAILGQLGLEDAHIGDVQRDRDEWVRGHRRPSLHSPANHAASVHHLEPWRNPYI